ncbi:MAG TPA: CoA-binding protein [Candidatus Binatia bacterium]|jgi:predicted CoA-binding protein|nr:CoA-binding protein [Candidatus Binatia bacterium]
MNDADIRKILEEARVIASVGLSSKPGRPSYGVCAFLKLKGYRIIPVNPNETQVLGETSYPDLLSVPEKVDVVQIFRNPDAVPAIVEEAIKIGAKVVWMQDGAGNEEAAERARKAGLVAVVDDCMMREYRRLDADLPISH